MLPLLADISPQDVGQLILTLLAATGGGYSLFSLGKARALKIEPQPLEIQESKPYATREELDKLRDSLNRDIGKLTEQVGELKADTAESKGELKTISKNQEKILNLLLNHQ